MKCQRRRQTNEECRINTHPNLKVHFRNSAMRRALTWLAGWVTGGGCFTSTEGSVSPFVWTISVGPLAALFSMMGIRSRRAGLQPGHKHPVRRWTRYSANSLETWSLYICIYSERALPHVVVFLEESVVLHSSLLQLHINAAPIYWNHLFDSAKMNIFKTVNSQQGGERRKRTSDWNGQVDEGRERRALTWH